MAVAGYVGYTVEQQVNFVTCAANHGNPLHTPSITTRIRNLRTLPIMAAGMSLWEFVLNYNNRNGAIPIPNGHVVVAKIQDSYNKVIPCGTGVQNRGYEYYEKFKERQPPAGAPPGTPGKIRDVQNFIVACDCIYCFTRIISAAIMLEPFPNEFSVPADENAVRFDFRTLLRNTPAADRPALQNSIDRFKRDFAAAVTLKITVKWEYDKCNNPPNPASCNKIHCFEFTAETFDPDNGGARTFITPNAPLKYQSNP